MHGFQCDLHPSKETVGICPSCLRERLIVLKNKSVKNADLWPCATLGRCRNKVPVAYYGGDGIRQRNLHGEDLYEQINQTTEEKTATTEHKKARKIMNFSGLKWLFCFKDSKPKRTKREDKDRPRDLGEDCFPAEGRRSLWISSVVAMSASERKSTSERVALRGSRSSFDHELQPFNPYRSRDHCEELSGKKSYYLKTKSTDSKVKRSIPDQGNSIRRYRRDEELLSWNQYHKHNYGNGFQGYTEFGNGSAMTKFRQRSSRKPDKLWA